MDETTVNDDRERDEFVDALDLIGKPTDPVLQRLTEVASQLWQAPTALVSVVNVSHQHFTAKVGMEADCTDREHAFCAHAIRQDDIFLIKDATQDPRFANNPLVTGAPGIRFYAGAPIRVRGYKIGTLCIIDTTPRPQVEPHLIQSLIGLASVAAAHITTYFVPRQSQQHRLDTVERMMNVGSWSFDTLSGESSWSSRLFALMERDPAAGPLTRAELIMAVHPEDRGLLLDHLNRYSQTAGTGSSVTLRVTLPSVGYQRFELIAQSSVGANPAGLLLEGLFRRV